jgi:hypothetical protein
MSMSRAKIALEASVGFINVKFALRAHGRNYNPECESCQ